MRSRKLLVGGVVLVCAIALGITLASRSMNSPPEPTLRAVTEAMAPVASPTQPEPAVAPPADDPDELAGYMAEVEARTKELEALTAQVQIKAKELEALVAKLQVKEPEVLDAALTPFQLAATARSSGNLLSRGGQVLKGATDVVSAPIKAGTALVEGESVSDELAKGAEGARAVADGTLSALNRGQGKSGPAIRGSGTIGPTQNNLDPATIGAVALMLWIMIDSESFCDVVAPNANCNVNGSISVDQNGNVSTPGGRAPAPTQEDLNKNTDPTLFGWMQKQFLQPWELPRWDTQFSEGWLVPNSIKTGITWFAEKPGTVTASGKLRAEQGGSPLMGSRRVDSNGSTRLHLGTDLASAPGDPVYAAFSGTARYVANQRGVFGMVVITSTSGHRQETLYVLPLPGRGTGEWKVTRGEVAALADNLHKPGSPYATNVPNHVHNQFRSPENLFIAPNNNFAIAKDSAFVARNCDSRCISHETTQVTLRPRPDTAPPPSR